MPRSVTYNAAVIYLHKERTNNRLSRRDATNIDVLINYVQPHAFLHAYLPTNDRLSDVSYIPSRLYVMRLLVSAK